MSKKYYFFIPVLISLLLCGCSQAQTSSNEGSSESTTQAVIESVEAFDPIKDQIEALGEATPRVISDETENYVTSLEFGEYSNGSLTYDIYLSLADSEGNAYITGCRSPALGGAPAICNSLPQGTELILKASETDVFPLFAAVLVPFTMQGELKYYTTLYCFDGSTLDMYFPEGKEGTFFPIITDPDSVSINDNTFYYTEEDGEPKEMDIVERDWL